MFPPRLPLRRAPPDWSPASALAAFGAGAMASAIVKLGLLALLLTAALPGGASAQALGTMQVTARVLPGRPSWMGLAEAQVLVQSVDLTRPAGSKVRRSGLVQARAELASAGERRRLLVTVDYPRN